MKIAICQITCSPGDVASNCRTISAFTRRAADHGCELAVFPEMADTGYDRAAITRHAGTWPGPAFSSLQETASKTALTLVCGLSEREGGVIYNSIAVFGPDGALKAKYRKTHLFVIGPQREDRFLRPGGSLTTVRVGGFTFGLMLCFDIRFPELGRSLVSMGAGALVCCAAWPVERAAHWNVLTRARALENRCYLLAANRCGTDRRLTFCGASAVIGPDADLLAEGPPKGRHLLTAEIDPSTVESARKKIPSLPHP
jgi:omega-amidase